MKISYNWLKDYISIDMPPAELADILTDIGLEVEGMETYKGPGGGLEGLVVGEVKEDMPHPNADKLKLTKVDIGTGELLQIVCGAPNVAAGQKVIVAPVNTTLYPTGGDPFKIKKAKIRGELSQGMICAEDEIGLGTDHEGIMVLSASAVVGASAKKALGIQEDTIFEIGLTPNRADAMGHVGVARDLQAALTLRLHMDVSINYPEIKTIKEVAAQPIEVVIENTEACPRYSGIVLDNITVKESPDWLQQKLLSVGLRPINNIVDITNFILLEYGQPLHAFNADAVKGNKVIVKNLPKGTKFLTLDETERELNEKDLMICNAEEGMCIAGVFGGANSGVKGDTTRIFLESAYFQPVSIRKTSGRHNLRTDAAMRYEKGTDPNITITALKRAVNLMQELAGATVASKVVDVYPNPIANFKATLTFKYLDRLIGHSIEHDVVKQILRKLEIEIISETKEGLNLSIPPFKVDVTREVDVIEEVLRVYGFNNIPMPELMAAPLTHQPGVNKELVNNAIAGYLADSGFNELLTNPLVPSKYFDKVLPDEQKQAVTMLSSANANLNTLRTTMLFSGLEAVAYNLNRQNNDVKFFDLGKTYYKVAHSEYEEKEHLALYLSGHKAAESWAGAQEPTDIFQVKAFVNNILARLGITGWEVAELSNDIYEYALECQLNGKRLATFGALNGGLLKRADIKAKVFYADINWTLALKKVKPGKVKFKEIPKFPSMRRDLALLLDGAKTFAQVEKIATEESKRILKSVNLFDVYQDKKLGDDKKSYAVSFIFEDEKKTLTDKDVDKLMDKLIQRFRSELQAEIR